MKCSVCNKEFKEDILIDGQIRQLQHKETLEIINCFICNSCLKKIESIVEHYDSEGHYIE